ncbi:hypothetical protein F5X96DRAFT_686569 [Biscogniauxia mediterranea]|nr:hypothetical protein F5X96DRAFT_686569 [Biscogniauxia mediterranea]
MEQQTPIKGCAAFIGDIEGMSKKIKKLSDELSSNDHPMVNGFIPEARLKIRHEFLSEQRKQQCAVLFLLTHGCSNCRKTFPDNTSAIKGMVAQLKSRAIKAEELQKDISARSKDIEQIKLQLDVIARLHERDQAGGNPAQVYGVDGLSGSVGTMSRGKAVTLNGNSMPPAGTRPGGLGASRHSTTPTHAPLARAKQETRDQRSTRAVHGNDSAKGHSTGRSVPGSSQQLTPSPADGSKSPPISSGESANPLIDIEVTEKSQKASYPGLTLSVMTPEVLIPEVLTPGASRGRGDAAQAVSTDQPTEPKLLKILEGRAAAPPMPRVPENQDLVDHLFRSDLERDLTIATHTAECGPQGGILPPIFQYGVQYSPLVDESTSKDVELAEIECRGVIIYNIRPHTSIRDVLSRVRGGQIVHATMYSTMAVIFFANSREAHAYVKYANDHSVFGQQTRVALANTPSFPVHPQVAWDMSRNFTRCLAITDFDPTNSSKVLASMQSWSRDPLDLLEEVWLGWCGRTLFLCFRGVAYATRAYHAFLSAGTQIHEAIKDNLHFVEDTCSRPLEELQKPAYLARGIYPSLLDTWRQEQEHEKLQQEQLLAVSEQSIARTNADEAGGDQIGISNHNTFLRAATMTTPNHCSETAEHTPEEGRLLVPKTPGGNPLGKWCRHTTCTKDENCRHFRVLSREQYLKEYNYDLYKKDKHEWFRNVHKYPIPQGAEDSNDHDERTEPLTTTSSTTDSQKPGKNKGPTTRDNSPPVTTTVPITPTPASTAATGPTTAPATSASPSASAAPTRTRTPTAWPQPISPNDEYIDKWRLPQNDPAYRGLIERDAPYALQSEVNAIAGRQAFRSYTVAEMRERYAGMVAHRRREDRCRRGEDAYYDYLNAREEKTRRGEQIESFGEWVEKNDEWKNW